MASSLQNRLRRASHLTNEWPPRQSVDENCRKRSATDDSSANSPADCYWHDDDEERARRYEGTKYPGNRQGDAASDHELYNVLEERTSDEGSLTEVEANDYGHGDVRPTYREREPTPKKYEKSSREYPVSCAHGKAQGPYRAGKCESVVDDDDDDEGRSEAEAAAATNPSAPSPNSQRNLRDYVNSLDLPQAFIAMKKLERLKELQRRRDLAEQYYSQEIRRLIGGNFSGNSAADTNAGTRGRNAALGNRVNNEAPISGETRMRAGGFTKEPEPCGTMTTITRLNCGCVQQKTRRIFNVSIGHVEKCDGHQFQERAVPKINSNPEELTYASGERRTKQASSSPVRMKGRLLADSGTLQKLPYPVPRDLENWQDRRTSSAQGRLRKSPRNLSPVRKYDDTSSN